MVMMMMMMVIACPAVFRGIGSRHGGLSFHLFLVQFHRSIWRQAGTNDKEAELTGSGTMHPARWPISVTLSLFGSWEESPAERDRGR